MIHVHSHIKNRKLRFRFSTLDTDSSTSKQAARRTKTRCVSLLRLRLATPKRSPPPVVCARIPCSQKLKELKLYFFYFFFKFKAWCFFPDARGSEGGTGDGVFVGYIRNQATKNKLITLVRRHATPDLGVLFALFTVCIDGVSPTRCTAQTIQIIQRPSVWSPPATECSGPVCGS